MHAFVTCVLLIATVVLGGGVFVLVAAGFLALFAFGLWGKYRRDVLLAEVKVPPHRSRLDVLVAGDARASLLAPLVLVVFALMMAPHIPHVASYVHDSLATVTFVLVVVYGSSLSDWYVTLPRMTGLLGPRPCRRDGVFKTFPRTWREVTRWWYFHRIVADFVLVYGVALAVGMVAAGLTGASSPWVDLSFTVVFGTLGAYKKAIWPALMEWMHPHLLVGATVANRFNERRYVYDVAIEGVQVVSAEEYEGRGERLGSNERPKYEDEPEWVPLAQVAEMRQAAPYTGCERRCAGISWYCIENEDCFRPK
jgi:hypothetical protein